MGGKEGSEDPHSGSVYAAEGQRPLGGVSELRLGNPNLGSRFGTGIWRGGDRSGAEVKSRKKSGCPAGRLEVEARV